MVNRPSRYPEIEVSGPPREMGQQIGEAARAQIREFSKIALARVNKTCRVSQQRAMDVAESCVPFAAEYSPDMMEEMRGVAEGSGVPLVELMLLQVRNQLTDDPDQACTAFAASASVCEDGRTVVAQNWDNDPALDELIVVLSRRPTGKPALINVTQAGLISYMGFNDSGIGACVNTLPAPSRVVGVPHYFSLRGIFEATSLDEAVHAVRRASGDTRQHCVGHARGSGRLGSNDRRRPLASPRRHRSRHAHQPLPASRPVRDQ